jgi:hypothetical protein
MESLMATLEASAFKFRRVMDRLAICERIYEPDAFGRFQRIVAETGFHPKVYHSIVPEYSADDLENADLFSLSYPDAWVEYAPPMEIECRTCGKMKLKLDTAFRARSAELTSPIVFVNNQFPIVSLQFRNAIREAGLKGAELRPFDIREQSFYLSARSGVGELDVRLDEFLGYRGQCDNCGWHLYDMHFGPQRYRRANWNGDDFVWTDVRCGDVLYSKRAYRVLKSMSPSVTINESVFLT